MSATVRSGLGALGRVVLVVVGVPLAISRLFVLTALPRPLFTWGALGALSTWSHLLLVVVSVVWLGATWQLLRELLAALRGRDAPGSTWSARWAGELAGLLLLATSGSLLTAAQTQSDATPHETATASAHHTTTDSRERDSRDAANRARLEELAILGIGLLAAAGVARRLHILRRLRATRRHAFDRPQPPSPEVAAYEEMLRRLGDPERIEWIECANRLLWRAVATGACDPVDVRLLRCGAAGIELLLTEPRPAPAPFIAERDGRWWTLNPEILRAGAPTGAGRQLPYLVPVGDDVDASYLLVLSPGRQLGLIGESDAIGETLAGIVLGLRTLPWAEELDIELVGIDPPPLEERCFQLHPSSPTTLSDLGRRQPRPTSSIRPRWRREPLAVIADRVDIDAALREAVAAQMGCIVAGEPGTETLVLDGDTVLLSPFGIPLRPPRLDIARAALVEALFTEARASDSTDQDVSAWAGDDLDAESESPGAIELCVFAPRPHLLRAADLETSDADRVAELVAYLLTHGRSASEHELVDALYPGGGPERGARLALLLGLARRALGSDEDGRSRLSPDLDGLVTLGTSVTGDFIRAQVLISRARRGPIDAARAHCAAVLSLVTTAPFLDVPAHPWLVAEGHLESATAAVVDAAHHLAALELATGNATDARQATAVGLLLEPTSELLVRDRLAIEHADGHPERLGPLLADLEGRLATLGVEVARETAALYRALLAEDATAAAP
jgi:hypothetical protein